MIEQRGRAIWRAGIGSGMCVRGRRGGNHKKARCRSCMNGKGGRQGRVL